jgi:hypothetical protein
MFQTTDSLLTRLHYDAGTRRAVLSSSSLHWGDVGTVLQAAFGNDMVVEFSDVKLEDPPPNITIGYDVQRISALAHVFGIECTIWLELHLKFGDLAGLLLIAPLPEDWTLASGFPNLSSQPWNLGQLHFAFGALALHWGQVGSEQRFWEIPDRRPGRVGTDPVSLDPGTMGDGLFLVAKGQEMPNMPELLKYAVEENHVPANLLPPSDKLPQQVLAKIDVSKNRCELDLWWEQGADPKLPGTGLQIRRRGLGFSMDMAAPQGTAVASWLLETGIPGQDGTTISLAGIYNPGQKLIFMLQDEILETLSHGLSSLAVLLDDSIGDLDVPIVRDLSLSTLYYAPGHRLTLGLLVGADKESGSSLLDIGPVQLDEVGLVVELPLDDEGDARVTIHGVAELFGTRFALAVDPGESLAGGLDPDATAHPLTLFRSVTGLDLPFSTEAISITTAWIEHSLSQGGTHLKVTMDGDVDLTGKGILVWTGLALDLTYHPNEGTNWELRGDVKLAGADLSATVRYDPSTGWYLEAQANPLETFSITVLLDTLAQAFDAAIPAAVPDVNLEQLGINYSLGSRRFNLKAVTAWTVPNDVPLFDGEHTVALSLEVFRDPASGSRQANISLDWTLQSDNNNLHAHAAWQDRRAMFSAELAATQGNYLGLRTLVETLGLESKLGFSTSGMAWDLFTFSRLSAAWNGATRATSLAAIRPLGQGNLLLELNLSSIAKRFEASWTPTQADGKVGIRDVFSLAGHAELLDDAADLMDNIGLGNALREVEALLSFHQLALLMDIDATSYYQIQARSAHTSIDQVFLQVQKADNKWGMVAGLAFRDSTTLGKLPILGSLPGIGTVLTEFDEHVIKVEPRAMLVSTLAKGSLLPPAFDMEIFQPSFDRQPGSSISKPFGQAKINLNGPGVAVAGRIGFSSQDSGVFSRLGSLIHLPTLDVQLAASTGGISLQAYLGGSLRVDATSSLGLVLRDPSLGIAYENSTPKISIYGALDVQLFGLPISFTGGLGLTEHSLTGHLQVKDFPLHLYPIGFLRGVHFKDDCFLEVGVTFGSELVLGFMGEFYIGPDSSNYNGKIATVVHMIGEIPEPAYVGFEIDKLDLPGVVEAYFGVESAIAQAQEIAKLTSKLPGEAGEASNLASQGLDELKNVLNYLKEILGEVQFQDAAFHWADSVVTLPDSSIAQPGVGFRGRLNILGWQAMAFLEMSSGSLPTLSGHLEAEPLTLGSVLRLWGDGEGVRRPKNVPGEGDWLLKPGGPVFIINTRQAPFLHADLNLDLFSFVRVTVKADISTDGLAFAFQTTIGSLASLELTCSLLRSNARFEAHGHLNIRLVGTIDLELISIDLDTELDADMELIIDSKGFSMTLNGYFEYEGVELEMPELTLKKDISALEDLAGAILGHIEDFGEEIFEDVLLPLKEVFEDAAKEVATLSVDSAREVQQVTETAVAETAVLATTAAGTAIMLEKETVKAAQEISDIANKAKQIEEEAVDKAAQAAKPLVDQAVALEQQAEAVAKQAETQVNAIKQAVEAEAVEAIYQMVDVTNRATHEAIDIGNTAVKEAGWIANQAEAEALRLADETRQVVGFLQNQIQDVEREIENLANQIARKLQQAAQTVYTTVVEKPIEFISSLF